MANLTAAKDPKWREDKVAEMKATVGVEYFMGGAVVQLDATGLLSRAVTTAAAKTAGVVLENKNTTDSPAGTRVRIQRSGTFEFGYPAGGATDAIVGNLVQWVDDNNVETFAAGIKAGIITEVVSATNVRVKLVETAV